MLYILDVSHNEMVATSATSIDKAFKTFKKKYPFLSDKKQITEVKDGEVVLFNAQGALGKKVIQSL